LGTAIALPWLEAMAPAPVIAKAGAIKARARRMAFFYVPNGVHMPSWTPEEAGKRFELPQILKPLDPFRDDLLVLTGLAQDGAFDHGDGAGDHARSLACFLTGRHPLKTGGANIRVGISVDQVAAQKLGHLTRLPSLELGCDPSAQSGDCDTGYSCAYSSNISWRSESTPMAKEINPGLVFDRLFADERSGETASHLAKRDLYRKSILDFVAEDANQLKHRLGANDKRKLDEYLTSVRELEQRIARTQQATLGDGKRFSKPQGVPEDYREHVRLMFDVLVLAFQGDATRIATFTYANEASGRSYPFIGVPEGHHDLSHHGNDRAKQEKIAKINHLHVTQFAELVGKLKAIREGDGTLLDHSMLLYGSGISDGDRHDHADLPIILVGKGGGTIPTGQHIRIGRQTPLNNLFLSMLDRIGAPVDKLGDSTGRLDALA
jgi:hypothetical protein